MYLIRKRDRSIVLVLLFLRITLCAVERTAGSRVALALSDPLFTSMT